jgi:hypothetical protein
MTAPDADDRTNDDPIVLGTPEGDGDFESDGLPDTGETSAGGQPTPRKGRETDPGTHRAEPGLKHLVDEIVTGKIQP